LLDLQGQFAGLAVDLGRREQEFQPHMIGCNANRGCLHAAYSDLRNSSAMVVRDFPSQVLRVVIPYVLPDAATDGRSFL
jgi:hypothetical protein